MILNETTTLEQKILIPKATPKQVYDAYVNPKEHEKFTGSKATGKPVVGGEFTAWDGYIFGKFLELNDGKRVVQEWKTTDWAEGYGASKLELTFAAVPKGTEITLVQQYVPKAQVDEFAEGWEEFYWKPLKEYFKKPRK
jgi:activator of HSP90 ATPase